MKKIISTDDVNSISVEDWVSHIINASKSKDTEKIRLMDFIAQDNLEQYRYFYKRDPQGCGVSVLLSAWLRAALLDEVEWELFKSRINEDKHHYLTIDEYGNHYDVINEAKIGSQEAIIESPEMKKITSTDDVNSISVEDWVSHIINASKSKDTEKIRLMDFIAQDNLEQYRYFYKRDPRGCGISVLLSAWLRAALLDEVEWELFKSRINEDKHHYLAIDMYADYYAMIVRAGKENL